MSADPNTPNREEQVVSLLHAAAQRERAPEALRAEVATIRAQAAARRRRRPTFQPALRLVTLGTTAAAAAVVALVLALGGAGAPSLAQAAALAVRGPAAPAPALEPGTPSKLAVSVGRLHFPNWGSYGGWRSVGLRRDTIGNRSVTTVYYANSGKQIAYSIVSSPVLPGLKTSGEPYAVMSRQGRVVVIWQEGNHTCLLSGVGISPTRLWHLASTVQND